MYVCMHVFMHVYECMYVYMYVCINLFLRLLPVRTYVLKTVVRDAVWTGAFELRPDANAVIPVNSNF